MNAHYPTLTTWFEHHARALPWRQTQDPWAILLCEVMSQQTPVSRVTPTWHAWLETWPTPADLAAASPAEVLLAWDRMGYPRRALRLRECARVIVEKFNGHVPRHRTDLLSLPGIGPYTADAILAFAYHDYSVVLDTNIRRVLARWHGQALPAPSQTQAELHRATHYVPADPEQAWRWNGAIMEFGALVCTARNPRCHECVVVDHCQWKQAGYPGDAYASTRVSQKFTGTNRQARGMIMKILRATPTQAQSASALAKHTALAPERFEPALAGLLADGLINEVEPGCYTLPSA